MAILKKPFGMMTLTALGLHCSRLQCILGRRMLNRWFAEVSSLCCCPGQAGNVHSAGNSQLVAVQLKALSAVSCLQGC